MLQKSLFKLIPKHFLITHKFSKIFNANILKFTFSATANMKNLVRQHNENILPKRVKGKLQLTFINFRNKKSGPEMVRVWKHELNAKQKYQISEKIFFLN